MNLVDIGYVFLTPFTIPSNYGHRPGFDIATGTHVLTLDSVCEMYPRDNDFGYPGGPAEEPHATSAGNIKIFKHLNHVSEYRQRLLSLDLSASVYYLRINEESRQFPVFHAYLHRQLRPWLANLFFAKTDTPPKIADLGWDIADPQGVSLLHSFRVQDISSDMLNDRGLLNSFQQAEILGAIGNKKWEDSGKEGHGPFIEWHIGHVIE